MSDTSKRKRRRARNAPTMEDVARHAGVSAMTVSRVINRESNVSEATRAAVEAAIEALDYRPNEAARALAGARNVQIGIIYHEPSAYVAEFLFGAFDQLRANNAHFIVDKCLETSAAEDALRRAIDSGVDGVLMPPPFADNGRLLDLLDETRTPTVVVTSSVVRDSVSAVSIDDVDAARRMTRYLVEKGHRRIGFIIGDPEQTASGRRLAGFEAAMDEAGLEHPAARIAQGDFSYRSGLEAAARLIDVGAPPTAIFASNDEMAVATISVARHRGLDVPRQLSVVGFDDVPIARAVWPELTTIHQPVADMANAAAGLLVERILAHRDGKDQDPQQMLLDYRFVERESVSEI